MNTIATSLGRSVEPDNGIFETQRFIDTLVGKFDTGRSGGDEVSFADSRHTHIDLDSASGGVVHEDIASARIFRDGVPIPKKYGTSTQVAPITIDYAKLGNQIKEYSKKGSGIVKGASSAIVELYLALDLLCVEAYEDIKQMLAVRFEEFRVRHAVKKAERLQRLEEHTLRLRAFTEPVKSHISSLEVAYNPIIRRVPITYTVRKVETEAKVVKSSTVKQVVSILAAEIFHGTGFNAIDKK